MKSINLFALLILVLLLPALACATDLDGYVFKKISVEDKKAVVKTPQGELALVGEGDKVGESAVIKQIFDSYVELTREDL